jgi:hypothetical protein
VCDVRVLPGDRAWRFCGLDCRCSVALLAGDGGGLWITVPSDPLGMRDCNPLNYWPYNHSVLIRITGSTVEGNNASSTLSSGGGLHLSSGGMLFVANSTFQGNSATLFGGGLCLGAGSNSDTCALQLAAGTVIADNSAGHGSAQVFMACAADMSVAIPINLTYMGSQVGVRLREMPRWHPMHFKLLFVASVVMALVYLLDSW